jgi:hypothetical protein
MRILKSCIVCGKKFESRPSENRKFCGHSCSAHHTNAVRTIPESVKNKIRQSQKRAYLNGKLTGLRRHPPTTYIQKECPVCHATFKIPSWRVNKYCSGTCARRRPGQGGYRPGSVRHYRSGWYESPIAGRVWLDSSYEFLMARYLDGKGYDWIRNTNGFPYIKVDGEQALYIPDFYIKNLDLWVETKGYMTENDKRKLAAFPHKMALVSKSIIYDQGKWGF